MPASQKLSPWPLPWSSKTLTSELYNKANANFVAIRDADGDIKYGLLALRARTTAVYLKCVLGKNTRRVILLWTKGADAITVLFGAISYGLHYIVLHTETFLVAKCLARICQALKVEHVVYTSKIKIPKDLKGVRFIEIGPQEWNTRSGQLFLDEA